MQLKYGEKAKENGVYIVGACGWDSIPCDLGVNWIKQNFEGTLSHAETFVEINQGEAVGITRFVFFLLIVWKFCKLQKFHVN